MSELDGRQTQLREAFVTIQQWLLDMEDHITDEAQAALNLQAAAAEEWLAERCYCGVDPRKETHAVDCPIWDMELA